MHISFGYTRYEDYIHYGWINDKYVLTESNIKKIFAYQKVNIHKSPTLGQET